MHSPVPQWLHAPKMLPVLALLNLPALLGCEIMMLHHSIGILLDLPHRLSSLSSPSKFPHDHISMTCTT